MIKFVPKIWAEKWESIQSLCVLFFCMMLSIDACAASSTDLLSVPAKNYLEAQKLVQVEPSRRLNLFCMGHGAPTVLLDSGLGDSSLSWRQVQMEISRHTRVCSFDRAGYGFSDAANRPSTAQSAVDDMSALIEKAQLGSPIVLVAHSLGGMHALLFAFEKPQAVAGMVLVDPSYPGQPQMGSEADQLKANRACLVAAKAGELKGVVPDSLHHCLDYPENADNALHIELDHEWSRAQTNAARLSEAENLHIKDGNGQSEDDGELIKHWRNLGAIPLIVLSAGTVWSATDTMTATEASVRWSQHIEGHKRLAALSSQGQEVVIPNTTHYIQQIKPQTVIDAVEKVLAAAKGGCSYSRICGRQG